MKKIQLKSGNEIPAVGFGTWNLNDKECEKAVKSAIESGYRHIDTADYYGNHKEVGKGINNTDIARDNLFITSKVWKTDLKYNDVLTATKRFLDELNINYLDLLLIHWPNNEIPLSETFKAMQKLKKEELVKDIGVSNFTIKRLKEIPGFAREDVVLNQVEFHPYFYQKELLNYCFENDMKVTAYAPLARTEVFKEEIIKKIAAKYDKTPAQITLKWLIEKDLIVIPRSSSVDHIKENMELFNWELSKEDQEKINDINKEKRLVDPFNIF